MKVFSEVPIIGFKNVNSLKDHLVRPVLPQLDREGRCERANCSCEVCESVKGTTKFIKAELEETFDILKGPLDCNSNNGIYLFGCKKCQFGSVSFDLDLTTTKALIVSLERN